MVLQTTPNAREILGKIYSLLKSEGYFIFSIPHPCFWGLYKGLEKSSGYYYHIQKEYSIPFTITNDKNALPENAPYFHRTISWYINALHDSGLIIEKLIEPFPNLDVMPLYKFIWEYPHFLIMLVQKP
jgi:hypothetical protein